MDLEELRTVRATERERDSLQHLRDEFYEEVAGYLADRREARDRVAERADRPYQDPEVRRISDEIQTAESVAKSLYERRVGKVVKMASFAAADMPVEDEGLTSHERELFDELVGRIERNKERILDGLGGEIDLGGDDATAIPAPGGPAEPSESDPGADDPAVPEPTESDDLLTEAMGGPPSAAEGRADGGTTAPDPAGGVGPDGGSVTDGVDEFGGAGGSVGGAPAGTDPEVAVDPESGSPTAERADGEPRLAGETAASEVEHGSPSEVEHGAASSVAADDEPGEAADDEPGTAVDDEPRTAVDDEPGEAADGESRGVAADGSGRTTVRVTADVGEIVGVDDRTYVLAPDDVVSLPEENVAPLVDGDAAEPLE